MALTWDFCVDLLISYSKRSDFCDELATTLARLSDAEQAAESTSVSSDHSPRLWHVRDRLTENDLQQLTTRYHEGATGRELAAEFKIGLTNVKRLLREHKARRADRAGSPTRSCR